LSNSDSTASHLAKKLAESHNVDLTEVQAASPKGEIAARNVLDFLNLTAEEEAVLKRQAKRKSDKNTSETAPTSEPQGTLVTASDQTTERSEPDTVNTQRDSAPVTPLEGEPKTPTAKGDSQGPVVSNQALSQTRAQLQATALVHQKAVMQVGALRHQNEALDYEVARLRSKEESAQAFIEELERKKQELEMELEKSKKRSSRFAWLRKHIF
jgi:hypothetical protein